MADLQGFVPRSWNPVRERLRYALRENNFSKDRWHKDAHCARPWTGSQCAMKQMSQGMLKKGVSGVLGPLSCSRTMSTLRAPKRLRPC